MVKSKEGQEEVLPSSFSRWETEAQGREGGAGKKGKMQLICSRPPRKTDAEWEHESTFLTPPPFPPLHIQGLHLRAAWEFIRVNAIVCGGYQEEPTSSQMYKGRTICSSWINPAEKGRVYKWVFVSCSLGSRNETKLEKETSARTTVKNHKWTLPDQQQLLKKWGKKEVA